MGSQWECLMVALLGVQKEDKMEENDPLEKEKVRQLASPSEHANLRHLPFAERLDDWTIEGLHNVLGLHRHVVRLVEFPEISYVVKELPDNLVEREYRLLRRLVPARRVDGTAGVVSMSAQGVEGLPQRGPIDLGIRRHHGLLGAGEGGLDGFRGVEARQRRRGGE